MAIIGGGLAGAAAALALRRRGMHAIVLEKAVRPRWKIGESLAPAGVHALDALGLKDRLAGATHLASPGLLSAWGDNGLHSTDFIYSPYGCGYQVDRVALEIALLDAAQAAGATVMRGVVLQGLVRCGKSWELETSAGVVRARSVVDASGRSATVARRLGRRQHALDRLAAVFVQTAATQQTLLDTRTVIEACQSGWWYAAITPSKRHTLAFHSDVDMLKKQSWQQATWFVSALAATKYVNRVPMGVMEPQRLIKLAAANSCRLDRFGGDGWLAIGDAAIARDPLSGQGMSMALEAGIAAADALADGRASAIDTYCARLESDWIDYVRGRRHYYSSERRWSDDPFWLRRRADSWEQWPVAP